jgi:phenylpyruvate tautomerase PptA (4-oxalocrotonate tautomerase family)
MPISYLDVPPGADRDTKKTLVKAIFDAMAEVWPFPLDHRIFIREWPLDSVSQDGQLGSEPARPAFTLHAPVNPDVESKRKMVKKINAAVAAAYDLPDFIIFIQEHPLEYVAVNGYILADDQQRVEEQEKVYG